MRFFLYFLLVQQIVGFVRKSININKETSNVRQLCSINPLVYENVLEQRSIGDLLKNIEKSDKVFLKSDMKKSLCSKRPKSRWRI